MEDNGLLFSSPNCWDKGGNLVLNRKSWHDFYGDAKYLYACRDSETDKRYFVKTCTTNEQTAEVLLSQIYAKHGFTTAIALPANGCRVVTNDLADRTNVELIYNYFYRKALFDKDKLSPDALERILSDDCTMADLRTGSIERWEELFPPEALEDRFRWNAFTIASGNSDDHMGNGVVFLGKNGIAENIGHFDYGDAGINSHLYMSKKYFAFYNDQLRVDRQTFIKDLAQNPSITKHFNPKEVADELGSVDVVGVAQDIKQTIGFNANQTVVDNIARSFEQTANDFLELSH